MGNTRFIARLFVFLIRFIPTRVGNTWTRARRLEPHYGSSPRVWGIRRCWVRFRCSPSVHPHACGEYLECRDRSFLTAGSSPRVWGIRPAHSSPLFKPVGSSPRVWGIHHPHSAARRWRTVHPHACGEYTGVACVQTGRNGSSPRVWGIRYVHFSIAALMIGSSPRVWGIPSRRSSHAR